MGCADRKGENERPRSLLKHCRFLCCSMYSCSIRHLSDRLNEISANTALCLSISVAFTLSGEHCLGLTSMAEQVVWRKVPKCN